MPAVPVMPLGDDEQEVLLVDDQVRVALALFAIDVDAAESDILGEPADATTVMIIL